MERTSMSALNGTAAASKNSPRLCASGSSTSAKAGWYFADPGVQVGRAWRRRSA